MKKRKRAAAVCLAAGLLLLSACSSAETAREETEWDQFLSQTDEQHQSSATQGNPPDLTAYPYPNTLAGTYDPQSPWYLEAGEGKSTLTAQEATEDAEAFFQLLHDFYGGYGYFGGDQAFQPALEQVLSELSGKTKVSDKSLQQSLESVLGPLILDGHFAINGHFLCAAQRLNMYYVPDLYLDEEQAADMDPLYVKRTIGPDGALSWCFAALTSEGSDLPEALGEYTGLDWTLAEAAPGVGSTVYERRETDGLTVLVNQVLSDVGTEGDSWYERMDQLNEFAGSGESYRGLPVFVIDLRGNIGGQPAFARRWFEGFAGTAPSPCRSTLIRWSPLNGYMEALGYEVPEQPGASVIQDSEGTWVNNESIIFCLTDYATASAGEWFVGDLRTMEHVVFVGSNTCGATLMTNNQTYYLPHSGLPVSFGTSLMLTPEGNQEEMGFQPDLWVPPQDALEAVSRLCGYYSLNP